MADRRYVTLSPLRWGGNKFATGTPVALPEAEGTKLVAVGAVAEQAGALPAMPPGPAVPVMASPSDEGIVEMAGATTLRKTSLIYQMPKWRIARAKAAAGVGNARVVLVGDSTGMGAWALGSAFTGNRPKKWLHRLRDKIKQIPVSVSSWYGTNGTTINAGGWSPWLAYDTRITNVNQTVWDVNTSFQSGGFGIKTNSASAGGAVSFTFTPDEVTDTLDVYLHKASGLGSIQFDANGANAQVIDCNVAGNLVNRVTLSFTSGINAYNITKIGSSVNRLRGMCAYRNNAQIQLIDLSWNAMTARGYLTGNSAADVAEPSDGPRLDFAAIQPDLTIIALGINDSTLASPLSSFNTQYQKLIDLGKATGDVVIVLEAPIDYAGNPNQDTYWSAITALAAANNINVINFQTWPMDTWTNANALGLYADGRHPVAAGYECMAQTIYDSGLFGV